ncbi:hypothetical protein [Mycobacterium aquaticum]|uniref:Uncharacterized protein n=1 Tax=Mycobacterium aquaticum TaxID=1927124 RepID=A0A1X0A4Z3_9MYCO|nr:hypothetical protein [Mycobacterium aquaticum]ORA25153.1 hypothetical protein BST13_33050 [Mycobacterium aquaticum]
MLTRLIWKPLGRAIVAAAVEWAKDPKNRAEAEGAFYWALGKLTDAIPGEWDNKLLNGVADVTGLIAALPAQFINDFRRILGGQK